MLLTALAKVSGLTRLIWFWLMFSWQKEDDNDYKIIHQNSCADLGDGCSVLYCTVLYCTVLTWVMALCWRMAPNTASASASSGW